jgi:CheY-like chemotaxis protein
MELFVSDAALTAKAEVRVVLQEIQDTINDLSIGVSDVQWAREIAKLRRDDPSQRVALEEFFDGHVARFKRWCARRGVLPQVELVPQLKSLSSACLSPEYFGAALRALLRAFLKALKRGDKLVLSGANEPGHVTIGLMAESLTKVSQLDKKLYSVFASYFVAASAQVIVTEIPLSILVKVAAQPSAAASIAASDAKQIAWMMIVDDTPEVLNFYARVAEALGIKFYSADSVASAKRIVAVHGIPELLLTDIQLGDGSGLDLLKALKRDSGGKMHSIVVSGKVDAGIAAEVRAAGGDRHLVKPVGRKRLFEVIKELSIK